jgi:hypothetical protein
VARPQRASEMTRCANRGLTHCSRPPTRSPRRCGQAASADFEAQRLASPEIDAQFHSGGLLDSQVGGLLTSENPPGIDAALIDSTPPSHCRGSSSSRWPRRMCVMDSRTTLYIFADRAPLHQLAAIPVSFRRESPNRSNTTRVARAKPHELEEPAKPRSNAPTSTPAQLEEQSRYTAFLGCHSTARSGHRSGYRPARFAK